MTEEVTSSGEEKEAKRLTPAEWEKARALYELGEAGVADLSRRFGVSASAISQHFKKHGVVKGSRKGEVAEKTAAKVAEVAASFASQRLRRIEETKEKYYRSHEMIHLLIHQELVEAKRAGDPFSSRYANIKTLRAAAAGLSLTRIERYKVLNADDVIDETSLPEIVIRDLTDEEIVALREADDNPDELVVPLDSISGDDDEIVEEDS